MDQSDQDLVISIREELLEMTEILKEIRDLLKPPKPEWVVRDPEAGIPVTGN